MFGIQVKFSAIKQTQWYEYLVRFVFGGLVTVMAGLIAKKFGPVVGGLFLAFPSIFPASVTLVQTHKKKEEQRQGESEEEGKQQGIHDAGKASEGAALGSVGLLGFGLVLWLLAEQLPPVVVLLLALLVWFGLAFVAWLVVEKLIKKSEE
jgi:hypothetical protein